MIAGAGDYDRHIGRYSPALAREFATFAGIAPGARALDAGCGPGALAGEFTRRGCAVIAVDPDPGHVAACRARLPQADVRSGRCEALPVATAAVDAACAQLVLHLVDDRPAALAELARVTRPGGIVAVAVWDFGPRMPLLHAFWEAVRAIRPALAAPRGGASPWPTPDALAAELAATPGLGAAEGAALHATASYEDVEDAWSSLAAGSPSARVALGALDPEEVVAARRGFASGLRDPAGPFTLTARALAARASRHATA